LQSASWLSVESLTQAQIDAYNNLSDLNGTFLEVLPRYRGFKVKLEMVISTAQADQGVEVTPIGSYQVQTLTINETDLIFLFNSDHGL
jgi:hypothetical protein